MPIFNIPHKQISPSPCCKTLTSPLEKNGGGLADQVKVKLTMWLNIKVQLFRLIHVNITSIKCKNFSSNLFYIFIFTVF